MTTLWRGASLLLMTDNRLLLAAKVATDGVRLTGIGGRIEENETARDCALRECLEETGISATILESAYHIDVAFDGSCREGRTQSGEIATIRRFAITPPGEPWSAQLSSQRLQVEMFAACLASTPQPIEKLPFFVALSLADLVKAASPDGFNLMQALENETSQFVSGTLPSDCPASARIVDSPEALILALGEKLPGFLNRLATLLVSCQ